MNKKKIILISVLVIAALASCFWVFRKGKNEQVFVYTTADVTTGKVLNTVTATGTVQPVKKVDVGTQVSGVIKKIYVDYNSKVKKGDLLAELDKTPLLEQLALNKADLETAQSQLTYQEANYNRIKQLYEKKAVSETDYEMAVYQYQTAKASVSKMKTSVERAQTDLGYSTIYSPIDGVVMNRAVDEGQTVAASFNTPTLFTIAQDLTKMQVVANVDEADIGQVRDGQKVTFTVDAFPDDTFSGVITQIRLQPVTNANVVTYSVVVDAPNPELKLKPGLTASITVSTEEADNALIVPARALRFKPDSSVIARYKTAFSESVKGKTLWIMEGDSLMPRAVSTGLNDETNVEIRAGLKLGDKVVVSKEAVSEKSATATGNATSSPFMPKRPPK